MNLVRAFDEHPVVEVDAGGDQPDLVWDDRPGVGRPTVIAVEAGIAVALVVVAAAGVTRPTWLLVAGEAGHQVKDLWPHRHYVANTRWWPPFCLVVD